jgi:hypothetical protein
MSMSPPNFRFRPRRGVGDLVFCLFHATMKLHTEERGEGMDRQWLLRQRVGLGLVLLLLAGCAGPSPTSVPATATPDPCVGWQCTLAGVVYADAASPGNELAGTVVALSHVSHCSPTRGQYETTTVPDGGFSFEVFLHDTDTFLIQVEQDGYEPVRQSIGGFDCLYCACPPVEIVLEPLGISTPAP